MPTRGIVTLLKVKSSRR